MKCVAMKTTEVRMVIFIDFPLQVYAVSIPIHNKSGNYGELIDTYHSSWIRST